MTKDIELRVKDVERAAFSDYEPSVCNLRLDTHFDENRKQTFSKTGTLAERFHENTKYVQNGRLNAIRTGEFRTESVERTLARTEPRYAGNRTIELPKEDETSESALTDAIEARRTERRFSGDDVSLERLTAVLGGAFGTTGVEDRLELEKSLRAYPSPGGLYPVETYVAAIRIEGLEPGVYHYSPDDHELSQLHLEDTLSGELPNELLLTDEDAFEGLAAAVFLTGVFARASAKYGPRGYRYVLQESGHMAQNAQLVGQEVGLGVTPVGGFDDRSVNELLDIDGVNEGAIYALFLGETND